MGKNPVSKIVTQANSAPWNRRLAKISFNRRKPCKKKGSRIFSSRRASALWKEPFSLN